MFYLTKRGAFVSEPAILVRRVNSGSQVWSMEKLENKLVDMRDMYQEYKERILSGRVSILHTENWIRYNLLFDQNTHQNNTHIFY